MSKKERLRKADFLSPIKAQGMLVKGELVQLYHEMLVGNVGVALVYALSHEDALEHFSNGGIFVLSGPVSKSKGFALARINQKVSPLPLGDTFYQTEKTPFRTEKPGDTVVQLVEHQNKPVNYPRRVFQFTGENGAMLPMINMIHLQILLNPTLADAKDFFLWKLIENVATPEPINL